MREGALSLFATSLRGKQLPRLLSTRSKKVYAMGIVAEARWDLRCGKAIRHLKDVQYRDRILERKRQSELTNLRLLFFKIENVLLRVQRRARDWNPSYVDRSDKLLAQVDKVLEGAI